MAVLFSCPLFFILTAQTIPVSTDARVPIAPTSVTLSGTVQVPGIVMLIANSTGSASERWVLRHAQQCSEQTLFSEAQLPDEGKGNAKETSFQLMFALPVITSAEECPSI